jgi:hypothetical protein
MQKKQAEREAAEELRREVEFIIEPRRCVHIKMPSELHADFRVFGLRKKLSMQEMFIEFARLLSNDDSYLNKKMDDLARLKREKKIKKLTVQDSEDIYDFISKNGGDL